MSEEVGTLGPGSQSPDDRFVVHIDDGSRQRIAAAAELLGMPFRDSLRSLLENTLRGVPCLESGVDDLPAIVSTLDRDFRFTYANQAAIGIADLSRDDVLGLTPWDVWGTGPLVENYFELYTRVMTTGWSARCVTEVSRPDGEKRDALIRVDPILDSAKRRPRGVMISGLDATGLVGGASEPGPAT